MVFRFSRLYTKRLERRCRCTQRAIRPGNSRIIGNRAIALELSEEGQVTGFERDVLCCHRDIAAVGITCVRCEGALQHEAYELQGDNCHHTNGNTEHSQERSLPATEQRTR